MSAIGSKRMTFNRVFLGTDGISPELGICEADLRQTRLKELMAARADHVYVLAHTAKLGRRPFHAWTPLREGWTPVTDDDADPGVLEALRARGVTTVVTEPQPHPVNPSRRDEGVLRAVERGTAIGERHEVGDRVGAGTVGDHHELDPDRALRVVQPEAAGLGQLRLPRAASVPRTGRQPGGEQFQLGRLEGGAVDDGHAEVFSSVR